VKMKGNWLAVISIILGVMVLVFSHKDFLVWLAGIFLIANGIVALTKK
jgi:uncharacterized membrane protein HdeD (DUF308 family)